MQLTEPVPRGRLHVRIQSQWGEVSIREWQRLEVNRIRAAGYFAWVRRTPRGLLIEVGGQR